MWIGPVRSQEVGAIFQTLPRYRIQNPNPANRIFQKKYLVGWVRDETMGVIATVPMAITTLLTMMRAGDDGLGLGQRICRAPRVRLESAPGGTLGARLEGARAGAVGGTGTGSRRSSSRETGLDVVSMSPFVRAELRRRRGARSRPARSVVSITAAGTITGSSSATVRPAKWAGGSG